jgi:hypothetical protein
VRIRHGVEKQVVRQRAGAVNVSDREGGHAGS